MMNATVRARSAGGPLAGGRASFRPAIPLPMDAIAAFCEEWDVVELALFGSVLRDDFGDASDIDVLVTFADGGACGLFQLVGMEQQLEQAFGRAVEIYTRVGAEMASARGSETGRAILATAETIYARPR